MRSQKHLRQSKSPSCQGTVRESSPPPQTSHLQYNFSTTRQTPDHIKNVLLSRQKSHEKHSGHQQASQLLAPHHIASGQKLPLHEYLLDLQDQCNNFFADFWKCCGKVSLQLVFCI